MVGFVPGFAYMAEVDPAIAAPRRRTPRLRVPRGSVAIASQQTGIYPDETPGGWNIIGRCPLRPYDPSRNEPFLLRAGDRVRFDPIDLDAYCAMTQWEDA
jgi:inhibitor of KinA